MTWAKMNRCIPGCRKRRARRSPEEAVVETQVDLAAAGRHARAGVALSPCGDVLVWDDGIAISSVACSVDGAR